MNSILARSHTPQRQPKTSAAAALSMGSPSVLAVRDATSLRILLVDDCPVQQLLGCALLSQWGIMPQLASDGLEAVLLACEQQFDLILMDIRMGVLDGMEASKRIRHRELCRGGAAVPIVAYTAEDIGTNERAWSAAGISASLAKPCASAEMGECLHHWCGVQPESLQH